MRYALLSMVSRNAIINAALKGVSIEGGDMYIWATDGDGNVKHALSCFICKKMIINAEIIRVILSKEGGGYDIFHVEDWVQEWQKGDIVDDKQQYGADRNEAEGLS